jgi:hypothetical protein
VVLIIPLQFPIYPLPIWVLILHILPIPLLILFTKPIRLILQLNTPILLLILPILQPNTPILPILQPNTPILLLILPILQLNTPILKLIPPILIIPHFHIIRLISIPCLLNISTTTIHTLLRPAIILLLINYIVPIMLCYDSIDPTSHLSINSPYLVFRCRSSITTYVYATCSGIPRCYSPYLNDEIT